MNATQNNSENNTIEIKYVLKFILSKIGIIVAAGALFAMLSAILFTFIIRPEYSSTAKFMINTGSSSASSGIDAAKKLSSTYIDLLNSEETYEKVIKEAGVSYTTKQLSECISSALVEGTAILSVTVTTNDANEAAYIANAVSSVIAERSESYVKGASIEIVQSAKPNYDSISRSVAERALIGLCLGLFLSVGVLAVMAVLDKTVHDESYVMENYKYPMLAQIPPMAGNAPKWFGKSTRE